jgi:hypothetical protein
MGTTTRVEKIDGGMDFYEADMHIHLMQQTRLFGSLEPTSNLIQHTTDCTEILVRYYRRFIPTEDPSAFIVIYIIITQLEGETSITTTDGRQTLQTIICEYLFPRLRARTDDYEEDDEDTDGSINATQKTDPKGDCNGTMISSSYNWSSATHVCVLLLNSRRPSIYITT